MDGEEQLRDDQGTGMVSRIDADLQSCLLSVILFQDSTHQVKEEGPDESEMTEAINEEFQNEDEPTTEFPALSEDLTDEGVSPEFVEIQSEIKVEREPVFEEEDQPTPRKKTRLQQNDLSMVLDMIQSQTLEIKKLKEANIKLKDANLKLSAKVEKNQTMMCKMAQMISQIHRQVVPKCVLQLPLRKYEDSMEDALTSAS